MKRKFTNISNINIYRLESPTKGWQFRTHIGGIDRSKFFSDNNYNGSKDLAYVAATHYRDGVMSILAR